MFTHDIEKFLKMIKNNDLEALKKMVKELPTIDALDSRGYPVLSLAASGGWVEGVKYLLKKGARADVIFGNQNNCLTDTALYGQGDSLAVIKLLLKKVENVDLRGYNQNTALIEASYQGRLELVEYLLKKGADIHAKNIKGNTPLISAAKNGHKEVVRLLLKEGADTTPTGRSRMQAPNTLLGMALQTPTSPTHYQSNDAANKTAKMMAEERGFKEIAEMIEEATGPTKKEKQLSEAEQKKQNETIKEEISQGRMDIEKALKWAVTTANIENVKFILQSGAKVTNELYDIAAEIAASKDREMQRKGREIVAYLYEKR